MPESERKKYRKRLPQTGGGGWSPQEAKRDVKTSRGWEYGSKLKQEIRKKHKTTKIK